MWNVRHNLHEMPELTEINRLPMHGAEVPFANAAKAGSARSICSVVTQYAILTYPGNPKSSLETRSSSYFFARSQNALASFSSAFTKR